MQKTCDHTWFTGNGDNKRSHACINRDPEHKGCHKCSCSATVPNVRG